MDKQLKRVFVCEFLQESNSFNPVLAKYDDFVRAGIYEGEDLVNSNGKAGETVRGMLETLKKREYTAIGGIRMRAKSGAPVSHEVVDGFVEKTLKAIKEALPLNAVVVSLHGATVSDVSDDVCGDILSSIRSLVGDDVVIAASCDLHANITDKFANNVDFVCGYRTYPHIDHYEVGCRAASLAMDKVEGKQMYACTVRIPVIAPAHAYTTSKGKLKELMDKAWAMQNSGEIIDFTIFQAQPWMDIVDFASTVVVVADDKEKAKKIALELAEDEFDIREDIQGEPLMTIDEVIEEAIKNPEDKPVVIVDSADSPNAGACGDCATVIEHLLPYKDTLSAAVSINDKKAIELAFELGVGGIGDFELGASIAPLLSKPVLVKDAEVKSLHKGTFTMQGPAERGQYRYLGKCAVITVGQIQILLTSNAENNGDLQFYRGFGIEPTLCRVVSVKACTSLRAGYEPVSYMVCNTATPGAAGPVLQDLPFSKIPSPLYPFQEIEKKDISAPKYLHTV